jgi:predicted DNA-binding antitoxin AbrB/MazE fold protein
MSKALRAIIREGKIEPLEQVDLPEGSKVLVTLLADDEPDFWLQAGQTSLDAIWDNSEDDVYAQLQVS